MRAPESLTAALGYAARGWAVLAIRAAGKVPLTQHGVKDASTSELALRGWWRTWPDANVAIATGAVSGLVVLDVDPRSGGNASLGGLLLPPTLTAVTGGGGRHYLFHALSGARGRNGWRPGLDIKSDGGYIVAPPSIHASGGKYMWVAEGAELALMPPWLVDATAPPKAPAPLVVVSARSDAQVRRVRAWLAKCPPSIQGCNGSADLMRVAGRLAVEEIAGRLVPGDSWALICDFNNRCQPPWSEPELQRALERARQDPKQRPMEDRPMSRPTAKGEPDDAWMDALMWEQRPSGARLVKSVENATIILRLDPRWAGRIRLDTFASNIRVTDPPWSVHQQGAVEREFWADSDDTRVQGWLHREHGLPLAVQDCYRAVVAVAESSPFHPVRDWMDHLVWDGTERLDTWLSSYLGAEDSPYIRSVGRWWLISAVARTYQPGCKADHVLILEGAQGSGKSSALRVLASSQWFSDTPLDLSNKDAYLGIQRRLIVELSELDSLKRSEIERVKAFFSSPEDTFRAPYGRQTITVPRGCIFAGTTNSSQYLADTTGGRRFWPVACAGIDLEGLARDRSAIWAEAVAAYGAGENWWPDSEEAQASVLGPQEERQMIDEWEQKIADWAHGRDRVTVSEALREALNLDVSRWTRGDQIRVAKALQRIGWERKRVRLGSVLIWAYERMGTDLIMGTGKLP